jgi:ankyrin repeat protein
MMTRYLKYVLYIVVGIAFVDSSAGSYEDFFLAVNRDDGAAIQALLARGFDVNARSPDGQTALHLALRDQSPGVVRAVFESKTLDVDAVNATGETPLMMAALRGELAWASRLIERGAKVQREGWSPLHYAATGPEPKIVAMLLDRGAPIDARSPNNTTPLMMAAGYGAESSVDLLLARGADKRLRNERDMDAAAFASAAGRERLAARLGATPPR